MFRTQIPGDCSKEAGGYIQVCNRRSRQSEHQRSGIKLRSLAFHVWEDASLWAHWLHSFHTHLSCLGPILFPGSPCFLHYPSSSAITMRSGSICWIAVLGALIHIWRPKIADGCDISCLLIWQEIFSFHWAISFQHILIFPAGQYIPPQFPDAGQNS